MKPTHIIGIVVIAVAIGMIITTMGDASQYVTFAQAQEMAKNGRTTKIHVVGSLRKNQQGRVLDLQYDPKVNPNYFAFTLIDSEKRAERVVFRNPKPSDFERSEQVVVIGSYHKEGFVADKILMKCPSKYQENKLETKEASIKP
jgi:cytochrome c-type biogenesis protein CcmE